MGSRRRITPLLAVLGLAVLPASASGHAAFAGATPAPGARVDVAPRAVALTFSEPLNHALTTATLTRGRGQTRVPAALAVVGRRLVLRPTGILAAGTYGVRWRTVATGDGHALEGRFSFGIRSSAGAAAHDMEDSPLAHDGWLRILVRGALFGSLLLFAGAVALAVLLGRRWLAPWRDLVRVEPIRARERRITLGAGATAAAMALVAALADAADAAGGLDGARMREYWFAGTSGAARLAAPVLLALAAALVARRHRRAALITTAAAMVAVAAAGHAASAEPSLPTVVTDWLHLLAGSVWLGGIALIVAVWAPTLTRGGAALRLDIARRVLPTFGRVAAPAFLLTITTGVVSAVVELGRVSALWETGYGRVLAVKLTLVAAAAGASWLHAIRLRPRLLAANPHPAARDERRHWRALRVEPLLGAGIVSAVAVLVAFPMPPRESGEEGEAMGAMARCAVCGVAAARPDELSIAGQAGQHVVAARLRRTGSTVRGEVRVLGYEGAPAVTSVRVRGARQRACGRACRAFTAASAGRVLRVTVDSAAGPAAVALPTRWDGDGRRALARAQRAMRALRSVREADTVRSGAGRPIRTRYRLAAPDRAAWTTNTRHGLADTVAIGTRQWTRRHGAAAAWTARPAGVPYRLSGWFDWAHRAATVRVLSRGRSTVELVAVDPQLETRTPVWRRLTVDRATGRVVKVRVVAPGQFMTQRYRAFNAPVRIAAPR